MHKFIPYVSPFLILAVNATYAQDSKDVIAIKALIAKEVDALNRDHSLEDYLSCFTESETIQV